MSLFGSLLAALIIDSLLGLVGVFSLYVNDKLLHKLTHSLVAFAAGAILGGAIIHMLPEAMELTPLAPELALLGFVIFFILQKYLHAHHCSCDDPTKTETPYTIIFGDAIHNFTDGLTLAIAFMVSAKIGWITFFAIILHEIPQELGNFAILLHRGMSKGKAILWTFMSQLTCILGGLIGWFFSPTWLIGPVLALAAGGFIYIGASDLVPELHRNEKFNKAPFTFTLMIFGMLLIWGLEFLMGH
ncbi:MAG: ZIP family metal transporter [Candidatus Altiarchaeota archaeon]|nr:ZIP family metal transporter [Candidatus Altiarchaeota archaeon]